MDLKVSQSFDAHHKIEKEGKMYSKDRGERKAEYKTPCTQDVQEGVAANPAAGSLLKSVAGQG